MNWASEAGFDARWEPDLRLVLITCTPAATFCRDAAVRLRATIDAWAGPTDPYSVFVDCRHLAPPPLAWVLDWADLFKRDRKRLRFGVAGLPPGLRPVAETVRGFTRADIRVFARETEALAWLLRDDEARARRRTVPDPPKVRA